MPTTLVTRTIDGRVFLPRAPIPADVRLSFGPLHESTSPEEIARQQRQAIRQAAKLFEKEFPNLKLISHALTHLCDLPVWIVERMLAEMEIPFAPVLKAKPKRVSGQSFAVASGAVKRP